MHTVLALLAGSTILDALVRPRAVRLTRSAAGFWLLWLLAGILYGLFLAISGHQIASMILSLALVGLFTMISNAKRAMLGEPLVFSDFALIVAVFQYPQFYLSALTRAQKAVLVLAAPFVLCLPWLLFRVEPKGHLIGVGVLAGSVLLLALSVAVRPWSRLAGWPDIEADVQRHGLLPIALLYWLRWRRCPDPEALMPVSTAPARGELAVIVQCESFADPAELFGDTSLELPGLVAARELAWQWGNLRVSGFGAYTMRTEYGVLFGRSEQDLGFRRFDPYLTALGESSFTLPARLAAGGWRSLFIHPHDLRFYNREQIMRGGGFSELIGLSDFATSVSREQRYVPDTAIAAKIIELARQAIDPSLIYAVTIENHGPWETGHTSADPTAGYMNIVRNGDAMLTALATELAGLGRPATLVFFGDHRPSIPGVVMPGGSRDTPYVIVRLNAGGRAVRGERQRVDLTPAELHHSLLEIWANDLAG